MDTDFVLVLQENGSPYFDSDGDILIERVADGAQFYVNQDCISTASGPSNEISERTPLSRQYSIAPTSVINSTVETNNNEENNTPENHDETNHNSYWTKEETSRLIGLYKDYKPQFASTAIKNSKVWQKISADLGTHSAKQCENKFKYLKGKYLQKKDNMSDRGSGARAIHFEHFDEMDQILAREPIVRPVALASSSRNNDFRVGDETIEREIENNNQNEAPIPQPNSGGRSRRSIKLKEALQDLNKILTQAEADKQKRHSELMQLQRESMNCFSELMGKILDKF